jgi:peptidoglycan/LPS O-acetylase OafA/YrhL
MTGVLQRASRAVLFATACAVVLAVRIQLVEPHWFYRPVSHGAVRPLPWLGSFTDGDVLYLGLMFLVGASLQLYARRVPMHGALAAVAGVVMVGTMLGGGFYLFGLPAFAYLVMYAAVALPQPLARIGRVRDYSYGIYIYAFPVQQLLALVGVNQYGLTVYLLASIAGTMALAIPSWHFIERPALTLKDARWPLPVLLPHRRGLDGATGGASGGAGGGAAGGGADFLGDDGEGPAQGAAVGGGRFGQVRA